MNRLTAGENTRVLSIDVLRGIVMIIMALDHVRDFFHVEALTGSPTDLATTTPLLFFTRWITHYCAPTFVFLSGVSAYLSGRRKTRNQLSLFLIKRGIWLVLVEVFIITLAITFDPFYHLLILQVIWAIGVSMIILGILVHLPFKVLLIIGLVIVFGHNLLDYPEAARDGKVGFWWDLVHHANFAAYPISQNHFVLVAYAFLPWTGVMIMGYCFGRLLQNIDAVQRRKLFVYTGLSLVALFLLLRTINAYGDPSQWSLQRNGIYTVLSFLNVWKYPPSLMFISMTLGPSILSLAFFETVQNRFTRFVSVYGRVPFFYYVVHFYLIHTLCVLAFFLSGYTTKDIISPQSPFLFRPLNFGFSLWAVYAIWLFVVIILYPVCQWYDRYKRTHHNWWLSYL